MGYIRFKLRRITDTEGNTITASVKRMETDLPERMTAEYMFYELARKNTATIMLLMKLDEGVLDRDMLMGSETMLLDVGVLDCDTII